MKQEESPFRKSQDGNSTRSMTTTQTSPPGSSGARCGGPGLMKEANHKSSYRRQSVGQSVERKQESKRKTDQSTDLSNKKKHK